MPSDESDSEERIERRLERRPDAIVEPVDGQVDELASQSTR